MIGAPMPDPQVADSRTNPPCTPRSTPPVSCAVTHEGPVFRVERLEFASAQGGPHRVKDVVRHPGAVTVIAVRDNGMLVLVRNRRVAVDRWLVEFCAGKLERGEDPAAAAARELEEETGYSATRIVPLGSFFTSPGFADEIMHVFLATGLRPVPQRLEPGEELEVVELPEESLRAAIAAGEILDGKTLGAYLLWSMKRPIGGDGAGGDTVGGGA
jgi:ADP-ribose pyrophosphatase